MLLSRGEWEWLVSELGTDKAVLDALDGMARASGYVDANVSVALPFFT